MARPARVIPRTQSSSPVTPVLSTITTSVGPSRSVLPLSVRCWTTAATRAAMTADVDASGPAIAKGSELRIATTAAATAAERKVMATPYDSHCLSGPAKMSAA